LAVGEIPSLKEKGTIWRSEMLYSLLADYSITALQLIRLVNCLSCGTLKKCFTNRSMKDGTRLQPIVTIERDENGGSWVTKWKKIKTHIFDEQIQEDIILSKKPVDANKEED